MAHEVWILGATGRTGRAVAARLAGTEATPVLVGRDAGRLEQVAGGLRTVVAGSTEAIAARLAEERPAVVVNTIGPFSRTAPTIARAGLPGSHYVDLANDAVAVPALLGLHELAVTAGRTLVTGVGFGVLATEAVVATLCAERPTPSGVRVDALASTDAEAGEVGTALAATLVDGLAAGGRRYTGGRLVRARLGGELQHLTLPDGGTATSGANLPTGDLIAARLASGALSVTAGSGFAPTAPLVRAVLPVAAALLALPPLRALAVRRLAAVRVAARPRTREHSWGHAVVRWPDGTVREGWLRTGDAMAYTAAVVAEVTLRLVRGEARPGAFTPAAAFGPGLAVDAGGEFVLG